MWVYAFSHVGKVAGMRVWVYRGDITKCWEGDVSRDIASTTLANASRAVGDIG